MLLFANDTLKADYFDKLSNSVVHILADIVDKLSRDKMRAVVTSVMRTKEKQETICKEIGMPYYASLHEYGHAVDFVTDPLCPSAYALSLCEEINKEYPYRGKKKTVSLIWHQGTGLTKHFHLQTAIEN